MYNITTYLNPSAWKHQSAMPNYNKQYSYRLTDAAGSYHPAILLVITN